jgi:hypothetical protein
MKMDDCLFCGEKLGENRRKFCSLQCRNSFVGLQKNKIGSHRHICEKCGNEFTNWDKYSKYCSLECYENRNIKESLSGGVILRCTKCGNWKPADSIYFPCDKQKRSGFSSHCNECHSIRSKNYQATDRAKELRRFRRQRPDVKEKERQRWKGYQPIANHREAIRRKTDPKFALKSRMRSLMYDALKGNKGGKRWQDIVGYSVDDLRRHIEKQFKAGMTWERFLSGEIHIDHKIPVAVFNFTTPDDIDFKKCFALKNLQPMWAVLNISKGAKLYKPFQPSLALAV